MKVNFLIDDHKLLKYFGSSTAPKYYYNYLKQKIDIDLNGAGKEYDIVHVHSISPLSILKAMKYKKKGAIIVYTVHSIPETNRGNTIGSYKLEKKYYNWIYKKSDYLLAVSEFIKEWLIKNGFKNIDISYNAINTNYFKKNKKLNKEFRSSLGIEENKIIILNVAQLSPRKGIYDFIKIAEKNKDLQFIWIGGQPYSIFSKNYFKIKKLMKKKYENLIFYGFIDDVRKAYSSANIFLTPSYSETFGLTIIEATSSGLPVICRELKVYKSLFNNNVFYSKTINGFSRKINLLINKANVNNYIKKPLKIKNKFGIKKQGKKLLKFYESIIK